MASVGSGVSVRCVWYQLWSEVPSALPAPSPPPYANVRTTLNGPVHKEAHDVVWSVCERSLRLLNTNNRCLCRQCFCSDGLSVYRSKIDLFLDDIGLFSRFLCSKRRENSVFNRFPAKISAVRLLFGSGRRSTVENRLKSDRIWKNENKNTAVQPP